MKRTTRLKELLGNGKLDFFMESHSSVSGQIAEEAGFPGLWASSLAMSALCSLRDANELTWDQVADMAELMADATNVPILLDADTGYGNFNNARRAAHKFERRGIAGLSIEDKLFPKTNSFIRSEEQLLIEINEFCGKIKAIKDTVHDKDFCVVARLEGFIVGSPIAEVLERAHACADAGADALFIHSKKKTAVEIEAFMSQWGARLPIVIAPTTYNHVPAADFERMGISVVLWANHLFRASIRAMQGVAKKVWEERSTVGVEPMIVPVAEVFRLQNDAELKEAEDRYLKPPRLAR